MDKILEEISSLKEELFSQECVKQYFYFKNIIDNDPYYKDIDEKLKFHQKEMCKNKKNNDKYLSEKAVYDSLKKEFDSNPVLINYQIAKEEVLALLVDIKNILG